MTQIDWARYGKVGKSESPEVGKTESLDPDSYRDRKSERREVRKAEGGKPERDMIEFFCVRDGSGYRPGWVLQRRPSLMPCRRMNVQPGPGSYQPGNAPINGNQKIPT